MTTGVLGSEHEHIGVRQWWLRFMAWLGQDPVGRTLAPAHRWKVWAVAVLVLILMLLVAWCSPRTASSGPDKRRYTTEAGLLAFECESRADVRCSSLIAEDYDGVTAGRDCVHGLAVP